MLWQNWLKMSVILSEKKSLLSVPLTVAHLSLSLLVSFCISSLPFFLSHSSPPISASCPPTHAAPSTMPHRWRGCELAPFVAGISMPLLWADFGSYGGGRKFLFKLPWPTKLLLEQIYVLQSGLIFAILSHAMLCSSWFTDFVWKFVDFVFLG